MMRSVQGSHLVQLTPHLSIWVLRLLGPPRQIEGDESGGQPCEA